MLIHSANASSQFKELTPRFKGIRLAEPQDARPLADFFNQSAMPSGKLRIGFDRGDDFFSLLRLQGERYAALVFEENNAVTGVGALTQRTAFVRGRTRPVIYLQDLRISNAATPRSRQSFYQFFSEFVRLCPELPDFSNCSLFLTAILDGNQPAKIALSRPSFELEYTRLSHYTAYLWPKIPTAGLIENQFPNSRRGLSSELLAFYNVQLGRLAFDLTINDLERVSERSVPVIIREDGQVAAACLLAETNCERRLHAEYSGLNQKLRMPGTYITAMRVAKTARPEHAARLQKKLLWRALAISQTVSGGFTGLIATDEDTFHPSTLQRIGCHQTRGSLYRVFHPSHRNLEEFETGFLRPAQSACFDWIFS